jgi:alginate O-acetyltransferase complex protein AlgI
VTFVLVVLGWVLFRSQSLPMALSLFQAMAGLRGVDLGVLRDLDYGFWALIGFALLATQFAPNTWQIRMPRQARYALMLGLVAAVCVLMLGQRSPFLYFQF